MALGTGMDCLTPNYITVKDAFSKHDVRLRVPCGHCTYCKIRKSREWICRLVAESHYHKDICHVTLTYDNEQLHYQYNSKEVFDTEHDFYVSTLFPNDLQLFFKRLRRALDRKYGFTEFKYGYNQVKKVSNAPRIRYYAVGEYGEKYQRPHMHIILFGLPKSDQYLLGYTVNEYQRLKKGLLSDKEDHYCSWTSGHVFVNDFYLTTPAYVAGYVQKKLYGSNTDLSRVSEFHHSSQKLGIRWLLDHIYEFDDFHQTINFNGYKYASLPKGFRKCLINNGLIQKFDIVELENIQLDEQKALYQHCEDIGISVAEYFKQRRKGAKVRHEAWLRSRKVGVGNEND